MSSISKIYIASDPLMTKESEQYSNRRWMKDLLSRPIKMATGIVPESLASSRTSSEMIDRKRFFDLSGIEVDFEATQFWFDDKKITRDSLDYLSEFVNSQTLVVGYELSVQTRNIFETLGVPYVDVWLHPIRFMDDVLFGFNSNVDSIRNRLFDYNLNEEMMYLYADRVKIQTYKGWRREEAQIKANSALFVGQMLNDKSVCLDGRMLSVLDYKERFEQLGTQYSKVYYARHPYLKSGDEEIMDYLASLPFVELTDTPTYRLLSSIRIDKVISLSSSVIHEAKYFDKDAEFLFRPIMTFGDKNNPEDFSTIMQEYVSPHFWSDILSPIMSTHDVPKVLFLDSKDKIRDMLGFYWGYPEIDKVESLRKDLKEFSESDQKVSVKKPSNQKPKNKYRMPKGFYQNQHDWTSIKKAIDSHDIVSFDVFDTLIERVLDKPNDLFDLMAKEVDVVTGGVIPNFSEARKAARNQALHLANGEEVNLDARYKAMTQSFGLGEDIAAKLQSLEEQREIDICRERFIGKQAFEYAKQKGKKIILISDIFFDRKFMERLLHSNGYSGWHKLYLSSEEGVLKHTGRMFESVLKKEKINPKQMVHFGDNEIADIKMADKSGISTFHFLEKSSLLKEVSGAISELDNIEDLKSKTILKGLISHYMTNDFLPDVPGHSYGSGERLGYAYLGTMFFGFAKWILDNAVKNGVKDLYFLARDGDIVKKVYDIISSTVEHAPKSHYILASRRAVRVASIMSKEDVIDVLTTNFTPCPIRDLMKNRYGIDSQNIEESVFHMYGYDSDLSIADWKRDEQSLRGLFSDPAVSKEILAQASKERETLLQHYKEHDLLGREGSEIGFVDIGHSGTLQSGISKLLGLKSTYGYYFATFEDIEQRLLSGEHKSLGYAGHLIPMSDKTHPYKEHILMFESVFLNAEGSFLCFVRDGQNGIKPTFMPVDGESKRISMIKEIHCGILKLASDVVRNFGRFVPSLTIDGAAAIAPYKAFLKTPSKLDAEIFKGVCFENAYSGRDVRWVIPETLTESTGIWTEGSEVCFGSDSEALSSDYNTLKYSVMRTLVSMFASKKKLRKFEKNPDKFFDDIRNPRIRMVSKLVVGEFGR